MALVRHSSYFKRGKRSFSPNPSLAVMPNTPARTTRSGLNFRSLGGAAYGPKGYMAGAALDFAANRIKRAYTNYRAKSGKMFASHIPRQVRLLRFKTPRFDVGSKGRSSSRRVSHKKPSTGARMTRREIQMVKDFFMPPIQGIEYGTNGQIDWNTGRQALYVPPMYTSAKMDLLFNKGKDMMSNALFSSNVPTSRLNDYYDRSMNLRIVKANMKTVFVNMCNHDVEVHKYVFRCKKSTNKSVDQIWTEDLELSQTIQIDAVAPTTAQTTDLWSASPKSRAFKLLNKYYSLIGEKKIHMEVGSQHTDVVNQTPGYYNGTQWRNPTDLLAVETYASTNTNCIYWPGMIVALFVLRSKDFVVATLGTVTTPGSGRVFVNTTYEYMNRVPPPIAPHTTVKVDYPTGLVNEVNYNPETEGIQGYTEAGL